MSWSDDDLGAELRALREEPGDDALARMDARMAEEIRAAETKSAKVPWYRRPLLLLAPIAGTAAAVIIAVVVATGGSEEATESGVAPVNPNALPQQAAPSREFSADSAAGRGRRESLTVLTPTVKSGGTVRVRYQVRGDTTVDASFTPRDGGSPVEAEPPRLTAGGPKEISIEVPPLVPGVYTLRLGDLSDQVTVTE